MSGANASNPLTPAEANALRIWQDDLDASLRRTYSELAKRPNRIYCDSFRITPQQSRGLRIPHDIPRLPEHLHHLASRPIPPRARTEADEPLYLRALEGQSIPVHWHNGAAPSENLPDPAWPVLVPRRFARAEWGRSTGPNCHDAVVVAWTGDPIDAGAAARTTLRAGHAVRVDLVQRWFRNVVPGVEINPADLVARRAIIFEALAWSIEVDPLRVTTADFLLEGGSRSDETLNGIADDR